LREYGKVPYVQKRGGKWVGKGLSPSWGGGGDYRPLGENNLSRGKERFRLGHGRVARSGGEKHVCRINPSVFGKTIKREKLGEMKVRVHKTLASWKIHGNIKRYDGKSERKKGSLESKTVTGRGKVRKIAPRKKGCGNKSRFRGLGGERKKLT